MFTDLQNKVAVITGGSKELGNAIAKHFGKEGMNVVVNYHSDAAGAQNAVVSVIAAGGKAVAVQADIATEAGNQKLLTTALKHFGDVDVWVNNAGMENPHNTHELSLADWQRVIDVNLTGVFLGAKTALAYFVNKHKPGNIINMSSVHEQIPWPTFAHYAASKGGGLSCLSKLLLWNMRHKIFLSMRLDQVQLIHQLMLKSLLIRNNYRQQLI